ncbi:2-oxo acid dehydrogenase subunit E2 [Jonesia quinghaiensis]|uniref:2-oxo acid dehydrogenase subunit E2 n=1 Tax=Jonesia quinghaiensis TaxID=262806 RepID=UPI0004222558|nr:dihydrolipoamide acetyltransferase family protein [Jonesia quinghaiensis]
MPTFEQFRMPDAGEGLTEAEIVEWHVAVGDTVTVNQVILEVETAKSLVDLPSPFAGVVTQIHGAQGDTVEVGTVIMVVDVDPNGEPAEPVAPESGATAEVAAATDAPAVVTDTPAQPEASADAPVAAVDEPDTAPAAAPTDTPAKTDDASDSGSVLVGYGTVHGATTRRARRSAVRPTIAALEPSRDVLTVNRPGAGEAVRAKPPVRKLAKDLGVDLTAIAPTGPGGIVTREDVLAAQEKTDASKLATYSAQSAGSAASSGSDTSAGTGAGSNADAQGTKASSPRGGASAAPARTGGVTASGASAAGPVAGDALEDPSWLNSGTVSDDGRQTAVPVRSVRRRTAEAMVASAFTAPHVTVFHTVDVTKTMKLVERLRADKEFTDVRVTPLLITAKALMLAVSRHPEINASWVDEDQTIVYKHYVNLGIAAATPRGLVVPNIKDAHRLSLKGLAQGIADLTATARAGKTTPRDMSDGTITITNVGVFGIDTGTPILNPGESAILAFGAIRQQPWVHKGKIKKRWVTQLALSFDHRLVDGELGARVLADVAKVLEDPSRGLVWG